MSIAGTERLFTVEDYYAMGKAGILSSDERVELLDGKVLRMSPQGSLHAAYVWKIGYYLTIALGKEAFVRTQSSLYLDEFNEPEPDIAVVRPREDAYFSGHPGVADTLLIIEVGVTTWHSDRTKKLALYDRLGIPEVWLIHADEKLIEVYTRSHDGTFGDPTVMQESDTLLPTRIPNIALSVADLLAERP